MNAQHLNLSRHAETRLAQRGIGIDDIELISLIGTEVPDGWLVRDKDCDAFERECQHLLRRARRLRGKRVVVAEGTVITAYHACRGTAKQLLED